LLLNNIRIQDETAFHVFYRLIYPDYHLGIQFPWVNIYRNNAPHSDAIRNYDNRFAHISYFLLNTNYIELLRSLEREYSQIILTSTYTASLISSRQERPWVHHGSYGSISYLFSLPRDNLANSQFYVWLSVAPMSSLGVALVRFPCQDNITPSIHNPEILFSTYPFGDQQDFLHRIGLSLSHYSTVVSSFTPSNRSYDIGLCAAPEPNLGHQYWNIFSGIHDVNDYLLTQHPILPQSRLSFYVDSSSHYFPFSPINVPSHFIQTFVGYDCLSEKDLLLVSIDASRPRFDDSLRSSLLSTLASSNNQYPTLNTLSSDIIIILKGNSKLNGQNQIPFLALVDLIPALFSALNRAGYRLVVDGFTSPDNSDNSLDVDHCRSSFRRREELLCHLAAFYTHNCFKVNSIIDRTILQKIPYYQSTSLVISFASSGVFLPHILRKHIIDFKTLDNYHALMESSVNRARDFPFELWSPLPLDFTHPHNLLLQQILSYVDLYFESPSEFARQFSTFNDLSSHQLLS
jgi:hypothetical protein